MKINLSEYPEDIRVEVKHEYKSSDLDVDFVDLEYLDALQLEGHIQKFSETLEFKGDLLGKIKQTCGRCLKEVYKKIDLPFEFFFDIKGAEVVDATDEVRELLILSHPISFLCSEDCKGLCPKCGIDLNEGACDCKTETKEGSFTALKNIWQKKKEG